MSATPRFLSSVSAASQYFAIWLTGIFTGSYAPQFTMQIHPDHHDDLRVVRIRRSASNPRRSSASTTDWTLSRQPGPPNVERTPIPSPSASWPSTDTHPQITLFPTVISAIKSTEVNGRIHPCRRCRQTPATSESYWRVTMIRVQAAVKAVVVAASPPLWPTAAGRGGAAAVLQDRRVQVPLHCGRNRRARASRSRCRAAGRRRGFARRAGHQGAACVGTARWCARVHPGSGRA